MKPFGDGSSRSNIHRSNCRLSSLRPSCRATVYRRDRGYLAAKDIQQGRLSSVCLFHIRETAIYRADFSVWNTRKAAVKNERIQGPMSMREEQHRRSSGWVLFPGIE